MFECKGCLGLQANQKHLDCSKPIESMIPQGTKKLKNVSIVVLWQSYRLLMFLLLQFLSETDNSCRQIFTKRKEE